MANKYVNEYEPNRKDNEKIVVKGLQCWQNKIDQYHDYEVTETSLQDILHQTVKTSWETKTNRKLVEEEDKNGYLLQMWG